MSTKEPVRKREFLPALKFKEGSTLTDLLSRGPSAIKMLASASGHASVGIDANVVQEEQAGTLLRAQEATRSIQANMPKELRQGIQRGKRYWHTRRESFVTVVECGVEHSKTRHRAIDDKDDEVIVEERFLENPT